MAFALTSLSLVRRLRGNLSQWNYSSTSDDPTALGAAGYFSPAADRLRVGDVIAAYGAGTPQVYAVSGNAAGVVTVAGIPTGGGGGGGTVNNDDWLGTDLAVVNGGTGASDVGTARTNLGLGALATETTVDNADWSGAALAVVNGGTGGTTQATARTGLGLGTLATQNTVNNGDWAAGGADLAINNGGTGASTAADARTSLGLGPLATATTVGNGDWGPATDLAVNNGGTGASTATDARTNLGLGALATATTINNDQWSGTDLTVANGGTGASDAATARTNLGIGAGSETAAGILELAIASEINTGTDNTRAVSPDSLAGSYAGTAVVSLSLTGLPTDNVAVGDGRAGFLVSPSLAGMNLVYGSARLATAGSGSGTTTIQLRRDRAGTSADMLSVALVIATAGTVAAAPTINAANDDLATGDFIYADVDVVTSTPGRGGVVVAEFRLP